MLDDQNYSLKAACLSLSGYEDVSGLVVLVIATLYSNWKRLNTYQRLKLI
jgi:hypothetical protein